eukprot:762923-Hanusia_phi.AAC.2
MGRANASSSGVSVMEDVWVYDSSARTWDEITIVPNLMFTSFDCKTNTLNTKSPGPRAGHRMVAIQSVALMCGGYSAMVSSVPSFEEEALLNCWWLTVRPVASWTRLASSARPQHRWGHSMAIDEATGMIVIFGGMIMQSKSLGQDCWYIRTNTSNVSTSISYEWKSCSPMTGSVSPLPRYGHGSVLYSSTQTLYIFGGYAFDGRGTNAQSDMWALQNFANTTTSTWKKISPITDTPTSRAFHAMWLVGYKLYLHGGQGPGGSGASSVLSDTWVYDMLTYSWAQYSASDTAPVASHLSISAVSDTLALAFGGIGADGSASGYLGAFKPVSGWSKGKPCL